MRRYAHHRTSLAGTALAAVALTFVGCGEGVQEPLDIPPVFGAGNGAPSGSHYNLNIIGTGDKSADMTGNNGHRIFVSLSGNTKILLCESGLGAEAVPPCPEDPIFAVLDANGTASGGREASFALPNPDPENDGVTEYSVFARALGKPGDDVVAKNSTCGYALDNPDDPICSTFVLTLERKKGGVGKFTNVSKELLYVYADLDDDGNVERVPLFSNKLENYFWSYDNNGLRIAQLRFYPLCKTNVELDPSACSF